MNSNHRIQVNLAVHRLLTASFHNPVATVTVSTSTVSTPLPAPFSSRRAWTVGSPISFLMKQGIENPHVISLAAGFVDAATLPVEELQRSAARLFEHDLAARHALQYGTTSGYERLRRLVLRHFAALEGVAQEDLGVAADQVLLTTGSQQFLSLACEVLLDPGDICIVSGPTYFVFLSNLQGVGANVVTIPADADGLRPDLLEDKMSELEREGLLPRVKLIYVVSYYENPSGVSLSAERRGKIIDIARRWSRSQRILVLEDAAYRELRYDGPVLPSVFSHDESREHVLYTQTFSKTFSPGVRVGFGVAPADVAAALADRKGNEDFGSANLNQHLLAGVLDSGAYHTHVQHVRDAYTVKRDAMLRAAEKHFSSLPGVSWLTPHGGLYVWMSLPESIETGFESRLFRTAVEEGMMYVPGELCYAGPMDSRPRHQMRLSFGVETPAGIDEGMRRLANAIRRVS